jgi:hypothetical protein
LLWKILTVAALALLGGCALPANTALRDWARLASVAMDRPAALTAPDAASRDGLLAQQEALAIYLYALSVVATEESTLTFRAAAFAPLVPRAATADPVGGAAVAELGRLLDAARAGNIPPGARDRSAGSPTVIEDLRLRPLIRGADAPVQRLAASVARGATGQGAYRDMLAAIAEGHAMLVVNAANIRQRGVARAILAEEDRLRRLVFIVPPDAAVGLRQDPAGAVEAVVQP